MPKESDAQVKFTPDQIVWLLKTFGSQPIGPGLDVHTVMYEAGRDSVIAACTARCSAPETLHRALSNLQLAAARGAH